MSPVPSRLADLLERTITGPMWHGPALGEAAAGLSPEQAAAHPIAGAHSAWELVLHATAWADIARTRLGSEAPPEPTDAEDWPEVGAATAARWQAAVTRMGDSYRRLATEVRSLDDAALARKVGTRPHSVETMLHGVVEHGVYHAGQLAILKRALAGAP